MQTLSVSLVTVFVEMKPYKDAEDSSLGIVLAYSLSLFFLSALMIKVDATSTDPKDEELFGIFLVGVLSAGPIAIVVQNLSGVAGPILKRMSKARSEAKENKRKLTLSEEEAVFEAALGTLEMKKTKAAKAEDFETAIKYREEIFTLKASHESNASRRDPISEEKLHKELSSETTIIEIFEPHPLVPNEAQNTPATHELLRSTGAASTPGIEIKQQSLMVSNYSLKPLKHSAVAPAPVVDVDCEEL